MAHFTTELRSICEVEAGLTESVGYASVNEVISRSRNKIFSFDYPIFDEDYREILETKIIKHYYTREISAETYGRWKLFLDMRMNEIMPYYNKLYESTLLEFNPLYDVDYSTTGSRDGEQTKSESGTTTGGLTAQSNETITDSGTVAKTDVMTGTVSDQEQYSENLAKTGTVGEETEKDNEHTKTGTQKSETDGTKTRTDNTTATSTDSGSDTNTVTDEPVLDRWEYYSDTPQGSVGRLDNLTYLTNARHITETGNGSEKVNETDYGKVNTTKNTGTVKDDDDTDVLTTYNTTDVDDGSESKTTTYNTQDVTAGTDTNTRTYNTTDTINETNGNNRTIVESHSNTTNGSTNSSFTGTTTTEYVEHVIGKRSDVSFSKLVQDFRDTFINVDMLIIRDLHDLFFTLYE